jgi:glycosyltransferase involved in cell wall biosynthesis
MTIRVLLIAEAANPEWVSVPLVGWMNFKALRQLEGVDVHLVTQIRNKAAIERAGFIEGLDFTAIDSEKVAARTSKLARFLGARDGKGWTIGTALSSFSYYYFEKLVWQVFGTRIKNREFDIVHRVTPLSPTAQSSLAKRCNVCGIPFVLGPLNGGVPWPKEFDQARRKEREWLSYIRSAYKLMPGRLRTLNNASLIIVGSTATRKDIPQRFESKTIFIPENGIEQKYLVRNEKEYIKGDVLKICFAGRLVPYKGADMLLEAILPLVQAGKVALEIIGDGPEKARLDKLVSSASVTQGVVFHGWLSHDQVLAKMQACDLFAFPSIREFGGGVVIEAMSRGVVPCVVDYAGPGDIVKESMGYKVPIGSREIIISAIRKVVQEVIDKPSVMKQKSSEALAFVGKNLTWEAKAEQYLACYRVLLDTGGRSFPEFFVG